MVIGSQDKSQIIVSAGGTCFDGKDAVALYAATVLASALRLYAKTGMRANRAYSPTVMLQAATRLTGQKYRRGQYNKAAEDVQVWCNTMRAGLPVVEG